MSYSRLGECLIKIICSKTLIGYKVWIRVKFTIENQILIDFEKSNYIVKDKLFYFSYFRLR